MSTNQSASATSDVDEKFFLQLIQDIQAMDRNSTIDCDNAVFATPPTENLLTTTKKRKRSPKKKVSVATNTEPEVYKQSGWLIKQMNDAPVISWSDFDSGFQFNVQNPHNRGKYLLKLQLFENNVMKHISGIYINPETNGEVYTALTSLISLLENLWVDRQTGASKVNNVMRSMVPLADWRLNSSETVAAAAAAPAKRKKQKTKPSALNTHSPCLQ